MSQKALDDLRELFPGRFGLRAEEVALFLRGSSSRGVVQRVREGMKRGRYPGARKVDGLWQLPLDDLAEIVAPTPHSTTVIPSSTITVAVSATGRRKSAIGPRLALIRACQFWSQVANAIGELDAAQELTDQATSLRGEGRRSREITRARELEDRLDANTDDPIGSSKRLPPL